MDFRAKPVAVNEISQFRDLYRQEMNCQIIHDSLHPREGWTQSYFLEADGAPAGYGSIVVGGPWKGTRTIFEFYVLPNHRSRVFDLFGYFLAESQATAVNVQSNDAILTVMLHAFAKNIASESIVFQDKLTTAHLITGVTLGQRPEPDSDWAIEVNGEIAATGGILYHYNRPYGDIYMGVAEAFRRRGFGSYLVQELKRICYEGGSIPCARCNPSNIASRKTLQKAGFVPCAHILTGSL
jgi:ribosomal protein S18 acetylase RimI-like enzyme